MEDTRLRVHGLRGEACLTNLVGLVQRRIQVGNRRTEGCTRSTTPSTAIVERCTLVLNGAVVEYITELLCCLGLVGCEGCLTALGTLLARFGNQLAAFEEYVAAAADEVNGSVNFRTLPIGLLVGCCQVGVLVRQQLNIAMVRLPPSWNALARPAAPAP